MSFGLLLSASSSYLRRRERFLRFLLVGAVNTVFGYSIFAIIYMVSNNHNISAVVATAGGVLFNYFSTGKFVFNNRGYAAFLPFILVYIVALILNIIVLNGLIYFGLNAFISQALSLPVLVITSYFLNSRIAFRVNS